MITSAINTLSTSDTAQSTTSALYQTTTAPTTKCENNPGIFCTGQEGIFAHPTDCSKYIMCNECIEIILDCPSGQMFDDKIFFCNDKNQVDCSNKQSTTLSSSSSSTKLSSTTSKPEMTTCDGSNKIKVHPTDCRKYIICDGKNELIESCAENEYFNPDLMFCDSAEFLKCVNGIVQQLTMPSLNYCKQGSIEVMSHPLDCSKYIECKVDMEIVHSCPSGEYFNPDLMFCDIANFVECKIGNIVETTTTMPSLNYCKQGSIEVMSHPLDCSKYIECKVDMEIVHSCPSGEYFNPDLMFCDIANFVECKTAGINEPTISNSSLTSYCNYRTGNISYPNDCSKYIECANDKEIIKQCPSETFFNPELQECLQNFPC